MLLLLVHLINSRGPSPLQILDVLHQSISLPLQQQAQLAPDSLHARGSQLRAQSQHLGACLARVIAARGPACSSTCAGRCIQRAPSTTACVPCAAACNFTDYLLFTDNVKQVLKRKHFGRGARLSNESPFCTLDAQNARSPCEETTGRAAPHLTGLWTGETCAGRMMLSLDATAAKLGCPAGKGRSISFCVCLSIA